MKKLTGAFKIEKIGLKRAKPLTRKICLERAKKIASILKNSSKSMTDGFREEAKQAVHWYSSLANRISKKPKVKSKPENKVSLWSVSKDTNGTVVFKNKGATLYGISPSEFAQFNKFKSPKGKKASKANGQKRAAR